MAELVREARGTTARVASVVVDHQWVVDCRQVARLVVVDIQLAHATVAVLDAAADSWRGVGQEILSLRIDEPDQLLADAIQLTREIAVRLGPSATNVILAGPLAREQEMIDLIHNQVPHAHLSVASPGLCNRPTADAVTRPDRIDPNHLLQAHRYRPTFKRNGHDAHRRRWLRRSAAS